jgi:penicillin-binding protein 2
MHSRHSKSKSIIDPKRRNFLFGSFTALTSILIARLWYFQILKGADFYAASEKNRHREVNIKAPRGRIYDRNGTLLLSNRTYYDLVLIPQYLQKTDTILDVVAKLFHIDREVIEKKLKESKNSPKFLPIIIKKNLSLHEVALLESNKFFLPGVDIDTFSRRDHPHNLSAHLFGYLGEVSTKELERLKIQYSSMNYRSGSIIGKTGIERKFENYLKGKEGKQFSIIDAFGRLQSSGFKSNLSYTAKRGADIYITVDSKLQKFCEKVFAGKNGVICAMNPQNGAILAYLSFPNFDLSSYQKGLSYEDWLLLKNNPYKPLLDKMTGGVYPPGSTFKIVAAVAALEEGVITPEKIFNCPGYFKLGSGKWKCWKHYGHGPMNLRQAIQQSCDVYFYNIGHLLGVEKIAKWSELFGFGQKSGLNMNFEHPGIVPSIDWKLKSKGIPWQTGDTINTVIGQGYNLATPLQMLNSFCAIGNGGILYKPYLINKAVNWNGKVIHKTEPSIIRKISLKKETVSFLKSALHDVVMTPTGTGRRSRPSTGHTAAGKTGTIQNSALKFTKGIELEDVSFRALDHAVFACYSPSDSPEIALIVFSEYQGGGGGLHAAPIAKKILDYYWKEIRGQSI